MREQAFTRLQGNPYRSWIEMYASDDYQDLARGAVAQLDDLGQRLGTSSRLQRLRHIFADATRLEIGFWQVGLDVQPSLEH